MDGMERRGSRGLREIPGSSSLPLLAQGPRVAEVSPVKLVGWGWMVPLEIQGLGVTQALLGLMVSREMMVTQVWMVWMDCVDDRDPQGPRVKWVRCSVE